MRWLAAGREWVRGMVFRTREEREMDDEMRFHLEMETARLQREEGLSAAEARRRAAVAFGGTERWKEEVRDARGTSWVTGWSLDLRLGARMLRKHPGLSLVGGFGMAVAIAVGAGCFAALYSIMVPVLPLDEGERVVGIDSWNTETRSNALVSVHDFAEWRAAARTVEELGAFRTVGRNLALPGAAPEPVQVAEMTASGFGVARVPPLLGRPLVQADERPGAPAVVVLGHDVWRTRFASDPSVVGRDVRLGSEPHTVVGVMPEGFAFPVNHAFWTPLRVDPTALPRGEGPLLNVFGRLAPGATMEAAQAELATIGRRAAAAHPETHARLRPRVMPYTSLLIDGITAGQLHGVQAMVSLLLVVVAVNVAALVYARTATREGEIAVRTALGASRRRLVAQLFAEALVLSSSAAALGLGIAWVGLRLVNGMIEQSGGRLPFWMHFGISPGTLAYVVGLAILAAAIIGVVPALQATGRRLQSRLRELGGGTGMQLGRTWTALIVAQVAFAVTILPATGFLGWGLVRAGIAEPGFAAESFLAVRVAMDPDDPEAGDEAYGPAFHARFGQRLGELVRRLEAQPGVGSVSLSAAAPGLERTFHLEVEGVAGPAAGGGAGAATGTTGHQARFNLVDPGLFEAFGANILAGRAFHAGDTGREAPAVIVSRSFAREVFGAADPVGRRVRYVARGGDAAVDGVELGRWYEVVGVVEDFPHVMTLDESQAKVYHAATPARMHPAALSIRARGAEPAALADPLRAAAAATDPALRVGAPRSLDEVLREEQKVLRWSALALLLVIGSVLLLTAAGIYSMMSFTVTRRRREIGIRAALGADPGRILRGIFARAAGQLAVGAALGGALGAVLAVQLDAVTEGELVAGVAWGVLPLVAAVMLGVGLLAAWGPARRGLRIHPAEALRADA